MVAGVSRRHGDLAVACCRSLARVEEKVRHELAEPRLRATNSGSGPKLEHERRGTLYAGRASLHDSSYHLVEASRSPPSNRCAKRAQIADNDANALHAGARVAERRVEGPRGSPHDLVRRVHALRPLVVAHARGRAGSMTMDC